MADDHPEGRYRVGRRNLRTIYYQAGPEPTDDDESVGYASDPSWAAALVAAANKGRRSAIEEFQSRGGHV